MELILASIVEGALDFFVKGGFFMAILLVVSIVAGTVIILRSAALREKAILPPALAEEIERLQPGDDLDKLERLILRYPSALARILVLCCGTSVGPARKPSKPSKLVHGMK